MKPSVIAWLACVLGLTALAVFVGPTLLSAPTTTTTRAQGEALVGGDFTLLGVGGKEVRASDFKGRYMLVYFGFTHCPDICPTTLLTMQNALNDLGEDATKIVPIFITLDPERDDAETVANYVQNFSHSLIGLTGTPEQIRAVADMYKVYYSKVEDKNSAMGYMVDHSSFIYLMDKEGKYLAHFAHTLPEQTLVTKLREAIK